MAELEFLIQATKRDLIVSMPQITHSYDFLVDNGKRILKVQIKSNFQNGPYYGLSIGQGSSSKNHYSLKEVDVIACFIGEIRAWYLFPMTTLEEKIKITVFPDSINSKWNKYRDAWGVLLN